MNKDEDWAADPLVTFPFQGELERNILRFKYLLKLASDYNELIRMGIDAREASILIKHMESKNLSLESYKND